MKMAALVQLQIDYLMSAGEANAPLPDFMGTGCLKLNNGIIQYDFGPDAKADVSSLKHKDTTEKKRKPDDTPQKGQRRKRVLTSTPVKK